VSQRPRRAIIGIAGTGLTADEAAMLAGQRPVGVILFARNVADPVQLKALTASLRDVAGDPELMVLIDQEGGRVMRLRPPHWRSLPAMAAIGAMAPADGARAAWLVGRLIAHDLAAVGIDIACTPCLDLRGSLTTNAIGDRSFGGEPRQAAALGRCVLQGLAAGGVDGVVKHMPGHGRAKADSHHSLPVVEADAATLLASDLAAFAALADAPLGMTGHVLYMSYDPDRPATLSPAVIGRVIRGIIGFRGILMSDDLDMGALSGAKHERAVAALAAGCDLALVCRGDLAESMAVLDAVPEVDGSLAARLTGLRAMRRTPEPTRPDLLDAELRSLLAGA
jgi:beta-N-acetylhexosaminidase